MHNRKYCAKIKTTDTDPDRRFMMEQPILSFLTAYFSDLHIQCRLTDRKQLELADLDLGLRNSILMQEADAQKQAPFPFVQNTLYFIVVTTSAIIPFSVCR